MEFVCACEVQEAGCVTPKVLAYNILILRLVSIALDKKENKIRITAITFIVLFYYMKLTGGGSEKLLFVKRDSVAALHKEGGMR